MTARTTSVAVAQTRSEPGDVSANVRAHADTVRAAGAQGADVVVFPELSLTGYELDLVAADPSLILDGEDSRLDPLRGAVADSGATALVGTPVRGGSRPRLGCLVVAPSGTVEVYAKRNLFEREREVFEPGTDPLVVEESGARLAVGICADLADASQADELVALDVDAWLLGVLVTPDGYATDAARAADVARRTGTSVVLANHAAPTGGWVPAGRSGLWGPDGEGPHLDARAPSPQPGLLLVDVPRRPR